MWLMGPWGQELRRLAMVLALAAVIGVVTGYAGWLLAGLVKIIMLDKTIG
jgi:hypothetical protein